MQKEECKKTLTMLEALAQANIAMLIVKNLGTYDLPNNELKIALGIARKNMAKIEAGLKKHIYKSD